MRSPTLTSLFECHRPMIGTWLTLPTPYAVEVIASTGFDWLCVDMQHGFISDDALPAILIVFALFSLAGVFLSIRATSRSQQQATVIEVASRQRTLAERYVNDILLVRQGGLADPGGTARLMGQSALAKGTDELVAAYHPRLKRFIAPSSRTSLEYLLAKQAGLQYLLHTLSRVGTLHDVDSVQAKSLLPGLPGVIGEEVPPSRVALQAITKPWAPEWVANLIDEKPLPYRSIASGDGVLTSYLGHNYGLASATQSRRVRRSDVRGDGGIVSRRRAAYAFHVNAIAKYLLRACVACARGVWWVMTVQLVPVPRWIRDYEKRCPQPDTEREVDPRTETIDP